MADSNSLFFFCSLLIHNNCLYHLVIFCSMIINDVWFNHLIKSILLCGSWCSIILSMQEFSNDVIVSMCTLICRSPKEKLFIKQTFLNILSQNISSEMEVSTQNRLFFLWMVWVSKIIHLYHMLMIIFI